MGMKINFVIEEEDIVKEVHITTSPIEYLVISAALKQFIENPGNHDSDIEIAKQMRKVIENQCFERIGKMITDLRINEKGELEGKVETPQWDEMYYTKDDLVTMLEDLKKEIEKLHVRQEDQLDAGLNIGVTRCSYLIQQKIDQLKENEVRYE